MGSWFSNIHIRKEDHLTEEKISECIIKMMTAQQYQPITSQKDADAVVAILSHDDSQWVSICSDSFAHDDPESCVRVVAPFSLELHTDVMGISCFDSDYLYLNLVNAEDQTDAWIGIGRGKDFGIVRRNSLTAWKKKMADYQEFSAKVKRQYIFAEEFLSEAAEQLGLPANLGTSSLEYLHEMNADVKMIYLYFKTAGNAQQSDNVNLAHYDYGVPCLADRESRLMAINMGAKSKGLSVYFIGPYVEHDEITFSNVRFRLSGSNGQLIPVEQTKVQLPDGQWAYRYHDPEFPIPPGIPSGVTREKRCMLETDRKFAVWFTPHGNSRKMLDISVVFVPDKNPKGQTCWNVWKSKGSKKAFIDEHNRIWKRVRAVESNLDSCLPLLKEEDFD